MSERPSVCVFCGSSPKVPPQYLALAREVGGRIARGGADVVYGGASVGLMGAVADAALAGGARVLGVIPASLRAREIAHGGLTELVVVDSMATRKDVMFSRSTAFLTLPGGFGTLDELFEVVTLRQIGQHEKRTALLDHDGYWDALYAWTARAVSEGFVPDNVRDAMERLPTLDALDAWIASLHG